MKARVRMAIATYALILCADVKAATAAFYAQDTVVSPGIPDTSLGNNTFLEIGLPSVGLIRFGPLFGSEPGRIPLGAAITSATLTVNVFENSGTPVRVHRMLEDWNESSTWNSLGKAVDYEPTPTDSKTGAPFKTFTVTADVVAWSSGQSNFGWALVSTGCCDTFRSSEHALSQTHPSLRVDYTVPLEQPQILVNDGNFGFRSDKFGFSVKGGVGQKVIVEASTNAVNWTEILTATMASSPLYVSDLESTNLLQRYYRVVTATP